VRPEVGFGDEASGLSEDLADRAELDLGMRWMVSVSVLPYGWIRRSLKRLPRWESTVNSKPRKLGGALRPTGAGA
jgi:hypothetical protein